MEKSSKRGKIPQSDWPLIMVRYEAGETLSSIARTYDCSPPAISYVVSRSRARGPAASSQAGASAAIAATEPQLIKSNSSGSAAPNGGARAPALPDAAGPIEATARNGHAAEPSAESVSSERQREEIWPQAVRPSEQNAGTLFAAPRHPPSLPAPAPPNLNAGQGNGDHRPKLHLSLGNDSHPGTGTQTNGEVHAVASGGVERPTQPNHQPYPAHRLGRSDSHTDASRGDVQTASDYARAAQAVGIFDPSANGHSPPPARHDGNGVGKDRNGAGKDGNGAFIDRELRARVEADIGAFLAAFDAALADDTQESRSALREATDRLLRAGARTRIELERLEARMPLPRRNPAERQPGWQHR